MPLARWAHETIRVTVFALIGFALLRYVSAKFNVPGLQDALGAAGA